MGLLVVQSSWLLFALLAFSLPLCAQMAQPEDRSHPSQAMGDTRTYRLYLPPAYAGSQKRYPVIYWLHGYERSAEQADYGRSIAAYVGTHDVIAHLHACGIEVVLGPTARIGALGPMSSVYCRDPDGNLIEIASYLED